MHNVESYEIFRKLIKRVLAGKKSLPNLPSITLKIRKAAIDDSTNIDTFVQLIGTDPALSLLLMNYASSPIYKTASPASTIAGLVSLMGFNAISNIVTTQGIRSLFTNHNIQLKNLYNISRNRQLVKAGYSIFLAQQLNYKSIDEILVASFLSEVGTMALLSALKNQPQTLDSITYIELCRNYSKSLAIVLLTKWEVGEKFINIVKACGQWEHSSEGSMTLSDIVTSDCFIP